MTAAPTQQQVAQVAIKMKQRVERLLLRKGKMPHRLTSTF
jgi:hypothetical protein